MSRKRSHSMMTPRMAQFRDLPLEITSMILGQLGNDISKLIPYRRVNTAWRDAVDNVIFSLLNLTEWSICLMKFSPYPWKEFYGKRLILILGKTDQNLNGDIKWHGCGGNVSRKIYTALTGHPIRGHIDVQQKLTLKNTKRPHWLRCLAISSDRVDEIDGLIQSKLSDDVEVSESDIEEDFIEKLGDYDLTKYWSDDSE